MSPILTFSGRANKCSNLKLGVSHLTTLLVATFILIEPTAAKYPENFPPSMTLLAYNFTNWAKYSTVHGIWMAYPKTEQDVVDAVNWARMSGFKIRASGFQHNWSPLTVTQADTKDSKDGTSPIVLLKTARHLKKMGVISVNSTTTGRSSLWAQTGTKMDAIHETLEKNNLSFANIIDIGLPTLGGVISIAGHGTSFLRQGQPMFAGHTHGTLSNAIIGFTAVIFDKKLDKYVLKQFDRSHADAKYFLTSLGHTFITNVTMRVGPLLQYRVQSILDVPASQLLKNPTNAVEGDRTFAEFVENSNGLLVAVFPYTNVAWIRQFTMEQRWKPRHSRKVTQPYNYPTSAADGAAIGKILKRIVDGQAEEAVSLGNALANATKNTLVKNKAFDIWGTIKNTQMFTQTTDGPIKMASYALLTSRDRVQKVVSSMYDYYLEVSNEFEAVGQYPFTGPLEFMVTGVDDPRDCLVPGADAPVMSMSAPLLPSNNEDANDGHQTISDTVIWVSFKYFVNNPGKIEAARRIEHFFTRKEDAGFDRVRAEWCGEWAYSHDGPWVKKSAPQLFESFSRDGGNKNDFNDMSNTLRANDPFGVLSSSFLDDLFNQN